MPPAVVDADGLRLLAQVEDWAKRLRPGTVLTPHPGEMSVLTGLDKDEINRDRIGIAQRYAAEWGHVVVLKGAGTVVAAQNELPVVVRDGNPGMASGGMGDVLTGVIAGLLAQGMAPRLAAVSGASVHGHAADRAALAGERGLLAGDLLPHLRAAVNPS